MARIRTLKPEGRTTGLIPWVPMSIRSRILGRIEGLLGISTPPEPGPAPGPPLAELDAALVDVAAANSRPPDLGRGDDAHGRERGDAHQIAQGSIVNDITGLGGSNDKGATARPNTSRVPFWPEELEALYRFNGYARRIVDQLPKDGTRKGWTLTDSTDDAAPLSDDFKRLNPPAAFRTAGMWGRLYGVGAVFIVSKDRTKSLAEPLTADNVQEIIALVPLGGQEFSPASWGDDPSLPNFQKPTVYNVHPTFGIAGSGLVHASRVLYFPGNQLPQAIQSRSRTGQDESVLEAAWEAISHLTSLDQSGATLGQEMGTKVFSSPGLQGQQASDTADSFRTRMFQIARTLSSLGMAVIAGDERVEILNPALSGWSQLPEQARLALAAVSGIPQTLLFGETPSGLSTDGDSWRQMWAATVSDWQESDVRPSLEWLITLLYAAAGSPPDTWAVSFNPLDELTETEEATNRKTNAETDAIYITSKVYGPGDVREARFSGEGDMGITNVAPEEEPEEPKDPEADPAADRRDDV